MAFTTTGNVPAGWAFVTRTIPVAGSPVTMPLKPEVVEMLIEVAPTAGALGARVVFEPTVRLAGE
jgi:shikimate 5-dehydrogenase